MATRSGGRPRGAGRRSPGRSRTRVRPIEMVMGGVMLALVAGALAWGLAAAAGMDPWSWRHGVVTGIAVGAVAAMAVSAAVRPASGRPPSGS